VTNELGLQVSNEGDAMCLMVQGELDIQTGSELCDSAASGSAQTSRVLIDLSAVSFIDSSGVAALLLADRTARSHGSHLVVTAASPAVTRVLRLSGVARHLGLGPEGEAAG
jgi:anti-anti-sigma factor